MPGLQTSLYCLRGRRALVQHMLSFKHSVQTNVAVCLNLGDLTRSGGPIGLATNFRKQSSA